MVTIRINDQKIQINSSSICTVASGDHAKFDVKTCILTYVTGITGKVSEYFGPGNQVYLK